MSLAAFVLVWVAAWAVAWWISRPRSWVAEYDPPQVRWVDGEEHRIYVERVECPGHRHLAPYFATAVAWLFELVRWVASGCVVVALAGCCSPCAAPTWPPRPEWERLDPEMCHPQPFCEECPARAEWPGRPVPCNPVPCSQRPSCLCGGGKCG